MTPTVRRTQAERRAETERRVLAAAIDLIDEHGIGALSLAAVGTRAGYSRGIVTHHFGSRRALLDSLVGSLQDLVPLAPPSAAGPGRTIDQVDLYLKTLQDQPRDTRVFAMLWAAAAAGDPELRPIFTQRDADFRDLFSQLLRGGDPAAREDPTVDAEVAALAVWLVGQLRGVALQCALAPEQVDLSALRRRVAMVLREGLPATGVQSRQPRRKGR